MTLRISKILLISASLLVSCGTVPGNVKVYFLEPDKGLVRVQAKEVLPFEKARGFLCESKAHFQDIVSCTGGAVKIYFLEPTKGLVRKQANEVKPFSEARGYYCTSSADLKEILDKCKGKQNE